MANPFDSLPNPFAAAQGLVQFGSQFLPPLPPIPGGQRVTQMGTAGGVKTVAFGDGFVDTNELASWATPVQQRLAALESKFGRSGAGGFGGDMLPLLLVLLLGTGTGTSTDTTTLLLLVMMMSGQGGMGSNDSIMPLMLVLLLGGGI